MPLIKPEVQSILRESGLAPERNSKANEGTIAEKMAQAGLDDECLVEELYNIAKMSSNEGLKLRALETALKIRGALKDTAPPPPSFTIVIQPSSFHTSDQYATDGTNPILLPRQLLNNIKDTDKVQ